MQPKRYSLMFPYCKVMQTKLTDHLYYTHKISRKDGRVIAKEEREKQRVTTKDNHVVKASWVAAFMNLKGRHTKRICELLQALGHEVLEMDEDAQGRKVIACRDHKTGGNQLATFSPSKDEYGLMMAYNRLVTKAHSWVQMEKGMKPVNRKFVFICPPTKKRLEAPISCGSTEISRLQQDLGCELIPTVKARKAIVTASQGLQSSQQTQLADYLAHSVEVAKSKYREINKTVTVETAKIIEKLTEKDVAMDDNPIEAERSPPNYR